MKLQHFIIGNHGFTVAYTFEQSLVHKFLVYDYAFCSKKDRYNRKLARKIAGGRLEKTPEFIAIQDDKLPHWKVIQMIFERDHKFKYIPKMYRKFMEEKLEDYKQVQSSEAGV